MTTDPLETEIATALDAAGIRYETDFGGGNPAALDFYLPHLDVYIEVKQFHSPRIAEQMSRAENVIAIQGRQAMALFCELLGQRANNRPV